MELTNNEIYTYAELLLKEFDNKELKLPIKVNFYLVKNKNLLIQLAREIDQSRNQLLAQYGECSEDNTTYIIPKENSEELQKELINLFELKQDVQIYKISLKDFDGTDVLTLQQMEALMFMIEEE